MGIRLFLATWLSPERREDVAGLINRLRPNSRGIKWTIPEQMHFTLAFLGEQPETLPGKMNPSLCQLAEKTGRFSLALGPGGTFPQEGTPRVLWLGLVEGITELKSLAGKVNDVCGRLGLPKEDKPFKPHLTIGRVKNAPIIFEREILERGVLGRMEVKNFALVESRLSPSGPTYHIVEEYVLHQ